MWCCFVKSITVDPIVAARPLKQQHVFMPMSFRTVGWSTLIFLSYDLFLTLLLLHTFGHMTEAPSQNSAETRCRGFLVLESRCRSFAALESRCRGFLVLESRCRGICASTASFSFSLNLLCCLINVDM